MDNMQPGARLWLFGGLILLAIAAKYVLSDIASSIFFIFLLILYSRSDDEAFWFAFFLAVSDGIFSFFGRYEAVLTVVPGLPEIEVGQFYILLSVVKASRRPPAYRPFFQNFLIALSIYLIFLVVQSYTIGISMATNVQFRTFKLIVPLLLLYSLPRLFVKEEQYEACFRYLFPVAILAFLAQVFTIIYVDSPAAYLGLRDKAWWAVEVDNEHLYRGIYSEMTTLIAFFGALYYLARKDSPFSYPYLLSALSATFLSAVLSATRGWILAFSLALILFFLFIWRTSLRQMSMMVLAAAVLFLAALAVPVLSQQISNSIERMKTLNELMGGDMSAGSTLLRLEERGPHVIKKWRESSLTGWGFSDTFYKYQDVHVGNQNLLLHSGLIGGVLMWSFFLFFCLRTGGSGWMLSRQNPYKAPLLTFCLFLFCWFLIHSSSGQFFSYYQEAGTGMIQGIFFSFAALIYHRAKHWAAADLKREGSAPKAKGMEMKALLKGQTI